VFVRARLHSPFERQVAWEFRQPAS
jgi:hypothetical protein